MSYFKIFLKSVESDVFRFRFDALPVFSGVPYFHFNDIAGKLTPTGSKKLLPSVDLCTKTCSQTTFRDATRNGAL